MNESYAIYHHPPEVPSGTTIAPLFEPVAEPLPYLEAFSRATHAQHVDSCHIANDLRTGQSLGNRANQEEHERYIETPELPAEHQKLHQHQAVHSTKASSEVPGSTSYETERRTGAFPDGIASESGIQHHLVTSAKQPDQSLEQEWRDKHAHLYNTRMEGFFNCWRRHITEDEEYEADIKNKRIARKGRSGVALK